MKAWLRGQLGGLLVFFVVAALVAGGLGWVSAVVLGLERDQFAARLKAEQSGKLRLALWRLDSLVAPALAKEDSRPYNHYSAVFAPSQALKSDGQLWLPGTVLEPSPLLSAPLPDWMLLHFQLDASGWRSPQVLSADLAARLSAHADIALANVTPGRALRLAELQASTQPALILAMVEQRAVHSALEATLIPGNNFLSAQNSLANTSEQAANSPAQRIDPDFLNRQGRQVESQMLNQAVPQSDDAGAALENLSRNGENWFTTNATRRKRSAPSTVSLGPMIPCWLPVEGKADRIILVRRVQIGAMVSCQGILLDWPRLQTLLEKEIRGDLFPQARILPIRENVPENSERDMALLPVQVDIGMLPTALAANEMTPLRLGLATAWVAVLIGLTAVAVGGWSLIDLSERRFRFVSAVTHELRTPLTTLRLYLDLLTSGMIADPREKEEYLTTLNTETERLNRLVGNVLDFSRLENQRPRLTRTRIALHAFLDEVSSTWQGRCQGMEKELVLETSFNSERTIVTDVHVLHQIIGNLIDNACKYSHGAEDKRIWLRAREEDGCLVIEVEDRGPGVPPSERRRIFQPFRRGNTSETAGGAGLGLALARRWSRMLGAKLVLRGRRVQPGACFQLVVPIDI